MNIYLNLTNKSLQSAQKKRKKRNKVVSPSFPQFIYSHFNKCKPSLPILIANFFSSSTSSEFLEEFLTLLESAAVDVHPPILFGDFNLHVDDPFDSFAQSFLNAVEALGFQQHVQGPTHRAGHTLDLVLSRKSEDIISHISLLSSLPSDHSAI